MKSDRMSFNIAIARNTLRRCWPLWAAYLVYLIITLPVSITSYIRMNSWRGDLVGWKMDVNSRLLNLGLDQAKAAMIIGMLAVMVLFGYLYNTRGNTLMNSLPVKRGSLFLTLYLTGLIPMLLCQVLVVALTAAMTAGSGIEGANYFIWLGCAALGLIFFYGFSCFCAMLTGNLVVLPAVYLVLNFTAVAFESCVRECLSILVFGLTDVSSRLLWLSPFAYMQERLTVLFNADHTLSFIGLRALWLYAAAGLVFSLLAGMLYRRRRMECVSDFVAIPVLKPIFRVCMALGTAFVSGAFLFSNFFRQTVFGPSAAWLMAAILALGAVLGWVAAEMMIRRSVRVFPLPWKGLAAVCAVCLLTVLVAEADLTGYEKRVPDPEQVTEVEICFETKLHEQENIRALEAIHREIIGNKSFHEQGVESLRMTAAATAGYDPLSTEYEPMSLYFPVLYHLQDGSTMVRSYNLNYSASDVDDPSTLVGKIITLLNCQEAIAGRMNPEVPFVKENVQYAVIGVEDGDGSWYQRRLTAEEVMDLWESAMLPDAENGSLALYTILDTDENLKTQTNLRIEISLADGSVGQDGAVNWYHSYRVFTFSDHCLDWIREHTELEWKTMKEVRDEQLANQTAWG